MLDNPYQAPQTSDPPIGALYDYDRVKSSLRPVAIALIILSSLAMILDVAVLRQAIVGDAPTMLRQEGAERGRQSIIVNLVANGGLLLIHAIVLYGSVKMLRVQAYSNALTAAIVSLIPFCSPVVLLGIPFGIWAVVVMLRRDVRAAFRPRAKPIIVSPQNPEADRD